MIINLLPICVKKRRLNVMKTLSVLMMILFAFVYELKANPDGRVFARLC